MNLTNAADTMNLQADLKGAELQDIVAQDFLKKKKVVWLNDIRVCGNIRRGFIERSDK